MKTHNQNESSVTNQIEYTGCRQDSYLSFIYMLSYREGQALNLLFSHAIDINLTGRQHLLFILVITAYFDTELQSVCLQ